MVSTPIGSPGPRQSPFQTVPNLLTSVPNSHGHTFPVLFNQPPQYVQHEVQPTSLYSEYVQNPYNNGNGVNFVYSNVTGPNESPTHLDANRNNGEDKRSVFQSSNYFYGGQQAFIPPGSEILFGSDGGIQTESK